MRAAAFVIACALVMAGGCKTAGDQPLLATGAVTLGGRVVGAGRLDHGARIFTQYCRPCHGVLGDGRGLSALGLRPPPRDLRLGVYKFGSVPAGQLPTDADLVRIVRGGLLGTGMLPWDVPSPEMDDLIQYLKFLSPRWRNESAGEPIALAADPWVTNPDAGVERGRRVYHGIAQCAVACHPAYATKPEIFADALELTHLRLSDFRADLYQPLAKDSDFGVKILPPDFTFNQLRSGETLADICRSIGAGIGGTAMPTWKNVLPDADLWAMAHYVRSLLELRGTPAADELKQRLRDQPPWAPPPPPDASVDGGDGGEREH
ncbi:MAG TPA: c-type cytochrome [Polyangia bacterium]|nr:c-type cytochrome [Polyangia bacterium]